VTLEPSALTILFGGAIIRGITTPAIVSARNVIYAKKEKMSVLCIGKAQRSIEVFLVGARTRSLT